MKERDLLIAQTMAFVQSVTGKKPDADKFIVTSAAFVTSEVTQAAAPASFPDIEALLADTSAAVQPPKPVAAQADVRGDFQSEIRTRVANFRAHQERFNREREAYCSATMDKVHASIRELSVPPRLGK